MEASKPKGMRPLILTKMMMNMYSEMEFSSRL